MHFFFINLTFRRGLRVTSMYLHDTNEWQFIMLNYINLYFGSNILKKFNEGEVGA